MEVFEMCHSVVTALEDDPRHVNIGAIVGVTTVLAIIAIVAMIW